MKISGFEGFDHLRYDKYIPQPVKGMNTEEDIFTQIRKGSTPGGLTGSRQERRMRGGGSTTSVSQKV